MVKRTKGYILLLLLVITGLANRAPKQTLSGKERKNLVTQLKESKAEFINAVKYLSPEQLKFKPANKPSIKQIIQLQALAENNCWQIADTAVERPNEFLKNIPAKEERIFENLSNEELELLNPYAYKLVQKISAEKGGNIFYSNRAKMIKYVKTTTDDARHHFAQTPLGAVSIYQIINAAAANTFYFTLQINAVKAQPGFPK